MSKSNDRIEIEIELPEPDREPEERESSAASPNDAAEAQSGGEPQLEDLEDELQESQEVARLRTELEELKERSTRTLADFENYRKRSVRERRDELRYASLELVKGLLSVVDNLERALEADGSVEDLKAGVELTLQQFRDLLERSGVRRVDAEGEAFDPAAHEAISRFEDDDVREPTAVEQLQSGYWLHDRLLRPAIVKVAVPPEESPPEDE